MTKDTDTAPLPGRISDLQQHLDQIALDLDKRIKDICDEAASKTKAAVRDADNKRRSVMAKLLMLGGRERHGFTCRAGTRDAVRCPDGRIRASPRSEQKRR
jgi:hypothetical protein